MARVWRAWHRSRGTWCAVKVLRPQFAREPSARRRFMDEAKTMVKLRHRNVIEAWEVGDAEPPYLVLELADAGSLKDWSLRNGVMPPRMAVGVAIQICKGIGEAHRAQVIHRDVNPRNVLVNRKGVCKVSDFGIARIRRDDGSEDVPDATTVHSNDAMGTLGYMAPEQRSDPRRADVRTDVYGIGATLYDLLTGQPVTNLFMAEREPEMLEGIPEVLRPILIRAVAYHPEDRYPEVAELAKALYYTRTALQEDPPVTAQLAEGIPPEPMPPQGLTVPLTPGLQPMDDLEVPTTFIRRPDPARNRSAAPNGTPNSTRRKTEGPPKRNVDGRNVDMGHGDAGRCAQGSTPDTSRRSSEAQRAPLPIPIYEPPHPRPSDIAASPGTHGKSRESAFSPQSRDSHAALQKGSRSDSSRRVVPSEPSWISVIDQELPPKSRLVWKLLGALVVMSSLAVLVSDMMWLKRAEDAAKSGAQAFVREVRAEASVIDRLNLLRDERRSGTPVVGPDERELKDQLHLASQPAEDEVHRARAHAWLDALDEAASPFVGTEGRRDEADLRASIRDMRTALAEWEDSVETWHWRAETLPGRIPITLGLSTDPRAPTP